MSKCSFVLIVAVCSVLMMVGALGCANPVATTTPPALTTTPPTQTTTPVGTVQVTGVVAAFTGNAVIVQTNSGGLALELVTGTSVARADNSPGTLADLMPGARIDARYDQATKEVTTIKVTQPAPSPTSPAATPAPVASGQISGIVIARAGDTLVIQSAQGSLSLEVSPATAVVKPDGSSGITSDLRPGAQVDAMFDPGTRILSRAVITQAAPTSLPPPAQAPTGSGQISGVVVAYTGNAVVIQSAQGGLSLELTGGTSVVLPNGSSGKLSDLIPGRQVNAQFDPGTRNALKIQIVS